MSNDPRIDRIEERIAWLERHVTEQDRAMLELADANARLKQELIALRSRVSESSLRDAPTGDAVDERPPHY